MIYPNQKGFTLIEIALIVGLITVIGGVGYYAWSQNTDNSENTSQTSQTQTEQEQLAEDQSNDEEKQGLIGTPVNCNDEFALTIPEGWYSGTIENGGNCYVATQKTLPPHGKLSGEDISFVFTTTETSLALKNWVDEYFSERGEGEFAVTKTSQRIIKLNNGDEAILATTFDGHSTSGNNKSEYFFYKKGSLGIFTSWDASSTDEKLRDLALESVKTIK